MNATSPRGGRALWLALAIGLGAAVATPVACFFPGYQFDLPPGAGGATSTSTSSSGTTTTGMAGMGGMPSTTSSSSSNGTGGTMSSTTGTTGTTGTMSATSSTSSSSTSSGATCASKDCTDPACVDAYACVPAVPSGWTGPFELFEGAQAPAGCGTDYPTQAYAGNAGIQVPPAMCNCTCNPATGESCTLPGPNDPNTPGTVDGILVTDEPCGTQFFCAVGLETPPNWNWACYGTDGAPPNQSTCGANANMNCNATAPAGNGPCTQSVRVNPLTLSGGSCTANSQAPTLPAVTWTTEALACGDAAEPGTGCTGGATCLPIPSGGFRSGMCIMQAGMASCPAQFPTSFTFFGSTTDGRSCTACACGSPSGGACTAKVEIGTDGEQMSCTPNITVTASSADTGCTDVANNVSLGARQGTSVTITTPGSCTPSSTPTGTVTPTEPTTFCCRQ